MCIDKAKGIICKPMPKHWYSSASVDKDADETPEAQKHRQYQKRIMAHRKPYFFIYNYDHLYSRYRRYIIKQENSCYREYGITFDELNELQTRTPEQEKFLEYCYKYNPIDSTPCVMNKICWHIENNITNAVTDTSQTSFDPSILKAPNPEYSLYRYYQVKPILEVEYQKYRQGLKELTTQLSVKGLHGQDKSRIVNEYTNSFLLKLDVICPDEVLRCDLLIDIAYNTNASKKFVWETCNRQLIRNLLERKDSTLFYPVKPMMAGDFTYKGEAYYMAEYHLEADAPETRQNDAVRVLSHEAVSYSTDMSERNTEASEGLTGQIGYWTEDWEEDMDE